MLQQGGQGEWCRRYKWLCLVKKHLSRSGLCSMLHEESAAKEICLECEKGDILRVLSEWLQLLSSFGKIELETCEGRFWCSMEDNHHDLIEELYLEMYDMLLSYSYSIFKEMSLAEESVQETFRIACQKPEDVFKSQNPKGWLVNTLKFTIRNIKRNQESGQQILTRYLALQTESVAFSMDKMSLEVMYENVADLEEFKLVKEMAIDGKSHLEMAQERGISVAACKKRMQRAKEILRKKFSI